MPEDDRRSSRTARARARRTGEITPPGLETGAGRFILGNDTSIDGHVDEAGLWVDHAALLAQAIRSLTP